MKTILIIEDDISILRGLKDNLEFEGYHVFTETHGEKGLNTALASNTDLILVPCSPAIVIAMPNNIEKSAIVRQKPNAISVCWVPPVVMICRVLVTA